MTSPDRVDTRRGTVGVVAFIAALHVLGWGVLLVAVVPAGIPLGAGDGTALVTLGVGLAAYTLGLRHAFDADHIAAIDNTTRRLAERGRPASTVGFWFSLGHSTIVLVLCVLLTFGVAAISASLADDSSALHTWTGVIGPTVSGVFLLVIAAVNIASLRARSRSDAHHGDHHHGGPVLRLLGPFERAVDRPSRMYGVGLLFGLGFDTATEIGLLALAGASTLAAVPWWAVLTLPVLFAAGMSAFDTAQGAVMRRAYAWQPDAGESGGRGIRNRDVGAVYGVAMTVLSVVAAVVIALVQLSGVLVENLGLGDPFAWIASIGVDDLGLLLTALLLATWAMVLIATRRPRSVSA
ncbi:HoxN/HupN/NixA family nickel/cobalt transporter [Agromyces sp. Leaf222]|uniref:HoxN/HupN/NixA family nickel/cobalt transporter n=1 Tax=Agromyces sp. Leaf222 TaxID=1735688 RepID=UPI0006FF65AF|nr:high-affinity nickel-transport protein [Agromyces sp. Leaf222]KQM80601.1 high-affinity nickel-transport protein [Agromyces sp. Leaf222]